MLLKSTKRKNATTQAQINTASTEKLKNLQM